MTASVCMQLDILTLQEWGVDLKRELVPSPATQAYVQFLQDAAKTEVSRVSNHDIACSMLRAACHISRAACQKLSIL